LIFIKKGEEIRLCETLATNPLKGERCQNLIPERPGDDKNSNTKRNEFNSSDTQQLHHAAPAYVHVPVRTILTLIPYLSIVPETVTVMVDVMVRLLYNLNSGNHGKWKNTI